VSFGVLLQALIVSIFLAQNSLYQHVASVAKACKADDLIDARSQISHIVGRDPNSLDQRAISRAAIESLSENFSDGVVAPIFWYVVGGLPALIAYKALNTSDSMIGYLTDKYADFGWCAARFDDAANFIPARLSAIIITIAAFIIPSATGKSAFTTAIRDAKKHRSKNAGWPEAAMAGALGIKIAGPRNYDGILVEDAWMGDGIANVDASHIFMALRIYCVACILNVFWLILFYSLNF
jgi:adenosylcobinamide-phosphate synthase